RGRQPLRREGTGPGAPRRDPGARGSPRQRPDARRARVLDPAPPPEADRGVALAGADSRDARGDGARSRAGVPRDRLHERGHARVPARPGRVVLVHRAERPPAGRAPGHRARHRDRPRPRAASRRRRRAADGHRPRAAKRARDRDPDQRRGSRPGLRAVAGPDRAVPGPGRPRRAARHARRPRRRDPAALRLPDREAGRLGRRPAGGDRPGAARARRARDRRRGDDARLRSRGAQERRVRGWGVHHLVRRGAPAVTLSRRAARRTALFLLYQWDLTGQPLGASYEGEVDEFALGLAEAVAADAEALDARISAVSGDWPAAQLGVLERNILRIGIHELQEGTVPLEVAIDEAVTLAKRYASEDAGRLVNGILGRIARDGEGSRRQG